MKNEIVEYFEKNKNNLSYLAEETQNIITNKYTSIESNTFVFMTVLEYLFKEKEQDELIKYFKKNYNEDIVNIIQTISIEQNEIFKEVFSNIKIEFENSQIFLKDIEWKFIGLIDINSIDRRDIDPKILLKLIFSDDSIKIVESNYSNFKKLQEEMEENISSFNSVYLRRIIKFSK
jgi:hypothetical protein